MPTSLLDEIIQIAQIAGAATLEFWQKNIEIKHKQDLSPVTQADLAANQIITKQLLKLTPNIPILSEEACQINYTIRKTWKKWWIVDPLDGTKEFIAGNGDFTINIALINEGSVDFGIVFIPATRTTYIGGRNLGSWRIDNKGNKQAIQCSSSHKEMIRVIASQRHSSERQQVFLEHLATLNPLSLKSAGSSLKFCLIAEGQADCYPRFSPTCQWDTAAAQGVLEGAGGTVYNENGNILTYEARPNYLNPNFIAFGNTKWQQEIFKLIKELP